MCGIVGSVGREECSYLLLDVLKRLEYRGYDSSGLVTYNQKGFDLCRSVGNIANLQRSVDQNPLSGVCGLGHTRWATHGGVSESNAHPHISCGRVAIVHNGIIENHNLIRSRLEKSGYKFMSETDSEVLSHLFVEAFDSGLNLNESTRKVINEITGAFAFAAISSDFPNTIVVARNASPLAIGVGESVSYIGSDAIALSHLTRKIIYLKDYDYALVQAENINIFGLDGNPVKRDTIFASANPGIIDKGGYKHFMEKEMHEQPDAITNTIAAMTDAHGSLSAGMSSEQLRGINGLVMVGAGTSHIASLVSRYWIEGLAKIPVNCELASEYHYRNPVSSGLNTAIAISQSGESLDTLKAMRYAASEKLSTIGLVNVIGSTIARESKSNLFTKAGPEIGVASTKAFTAQLTVLLCFAIALGKAKGHLSKKIVENYQSQIQLLPGVVGKVLKEFAKYRRIAKTLRSQKSALFLGRGSLFPIALEGALKLKELSYIHAEGFASGEMKHGPIALIEDDLPVISLLASDELVHKSINNLREASARGARIILLAEDKVADLVDFADEVVTVPSVAPILSPIVLTIPVQILAYLTALEKGTDVDQPRNLAKSVTVE